MTVTSGAETATNLAQINETNWAIVVTSGARTATHPAEISETH